MTTKRALHWVFKVGNRKETMKFYKDILGMKILRHEEFEKGCEAMCNGPYDGKWSKTMVGYGPEDSHFVVELTYNYNISSYKLGNDFQGITIQSSEALARAKEAGVKILNENGKTAVEAPGGYKFYILDSPQPKDRDPVVGVTVGVSQLPASLCYWTTLLGMKKVEESEDSATVTYGDNQANLTLKTIGPVDHAKAGGRIAFSIPAEELAPLEQTMKEAKTTILTPLVSLDTPGKATVQVVILADPDGHEICFVGDEAFRELSQVDPKLDPSVPHFTGLDVRYQYNLFDKLRFRIKNTSPKVCPPQLNASSICNPRCVEIDKSNYQPPPGSVQNSVYISYDCEIGFYISKQNSMSVETTGHSYELSICSLEDIEKDTEICGEYIFQLPPPKKVNSSLENHQVVLLIDKQEYSYNDRIVMYIPTTHTRADKYRISIVSAGDKKSIYNTTVDKPPQVGNTLKVVLEHPIPSGSYQVSVTPFHGNTSLAEPSLSCLLVRPDYGQHALGIITAVLVVIIIVGCFLFIYRRWQQVAGESAIEPSKLVEAGRIEPKSVLVVTPLDNPDHVEVVKDLCRYLRDWCGVGTTYFALDEVTGIQSGAGQRDPWKWCQETGDEVRDDGVVVFIAGPNPALAARSSIHPNLDKNQAFLTTSHLRIMADQGRAIVVKFSYSDMSTVPSDVPEHLKNSAYHLPKYMNNFLCQLLQVKKRDLCSVVPLRLVTPEIFPANLTRSGGPELLEKIRELSLKEHQYRLEHPENRYSSNWNDRLVWTRERPLSGGNEGATSDSEDKPLYPANANNKMEKDTTLRVELGGDMPSVKQMQNRDKTLSDEV